MFSNLKIGVAKKRMATVIKKTFSGEEKQIQKVGLILDAEDEHIKNHFTLLKENLNLRDDQFQIVICDNGVKDDVYIGMVFSRKDLRWNGTIKNGDIAGFARQEMDVLISFTEAENKLAALLVSVANARLKVGRNQDLGSSEVYDIIISTKYSEVEIFINELEKYLKILNKK